MLQIWKLFIVTMDLQVKPCSLVFVTSTLLTHGDVCGQGGTGHSLFPPTHTIWDCENLGSHTPLSKHSVSYIVR